MISLKRLQLFFTETPVPSLSSFLKVTYLRAKSKLSAPLLYERILTHIGRLVRDALRDLETVTARAISTSSTPPAESPDNDIPQSYLPQQDYKAESNVPSGIQVAKQSGSNLSGDGKQPNSSHLLLTHRWYFHNVLRFSPIFAALPQFSRIYPPQ
jgi:hypothetical protein